MNQVQNLQKQLRYQKAITQLYWWIVWDVHSNGHLWSYKHELCENKVKYLNTELFKLELEYQDYD